MAFEYLIGINHLGLTVPDIDEATEYFKSAFGAKIAYDGLTNADEPRAGQVVEQQLGLPKGGKIIRQRMLVIGNGPEIEMFEIEATPQREPIKLADYGWNHLSLYVTDIDKALAQAVKAGGQALSGVHGNSRYEDTPGNGSVYVLTPWGSLVELQIIPHGHYYPANSETNVWVPKKDG